MPVLSVLLRQPSIRLNRRTADASDSVVSYAEPHRIWARERRKRRNWEPEQARKKILSLRPALAL